MENNKVEEVISHYGVVGMKWGVRRNKTKSRSSSDYKTNAALKKKSARELSNKELQSVIERVRLEQQFNKAKAGPAKRGRAAVLKVLATSLAGAASALATAAFTDAGRKLIAAAAKKATGA